jgi:hypothetical protein
MISLNPKIQKIDELMELVKLISGKDFEKHLKELKKYTKEANKASERAGKVSEIDKIHQELTEKQQKSDLIIKEATEKAQKVLVDAEGQAQELMLGAQNVIETDKLEALRLKQKSKEALEKNKDKEAVLNTFQTQLDVTAAALKKREDEVTKRELEVERKEKIFAQL